MLLFNFRHGDRSGMEHIMHLEAGFVFGEEEKSKKGNIANVIPRVGRMITVKKKNTQATPGQKKVSYIMLHTCWRWGIGYFNNGEGLCQAKELALLVMHLGLLSHAPG